MATAVRSLSGCATNMNRAYRGAGRAALRKIPTTNPTGGALIRRCGLSPSRKSDGKRAKVGCRCDGNRKRARNSLIRISAAAGSERALDDDFAR